MKNTPMTRNHGFFVGKFHIPLEPCNCWVFYIRGMGLFPDHHGDLGSFITIIYYYSGFRMVYYSGFITIIYYYILLLLYTIIYYYIPL